MSLSTRSMAAVVVLPEEAGPKGIWQPQVAEGALQPEQGDLAWVLEEQVLCQRASQRVWVPYIPAGHFGQGNRGGRGIVLGVREGVREGLPGDLPGDLHGDRRDGLRDDLRAYQCEVRCDGRPGVRLLGASAPRQDGGAWSLCRLPM